MIVDDKSALVRLNSPANLINKLRSTSARKSAMDLFGLGRDKPAATKVEVKREEPKQIEEFNPFKDSQSLPSVPEAESIDEILKNNDSQIKLGLAHDKALELLHNSLSQLSAKLDDVKADKLPSVISAASKTVESIRRERSEAAKNNKDREVHYHFYTPEQKKLEQYEIIDVGV